MTKDSLDELFGAETEAPDSLDALFTETSAGEQPPTQAGTPDVDFGDIPFGSDLSLDQLKSSRLDRFVATVPGADEPMHPAAETPPAETAGAEATAPQAPRPAQADTEKKPAKKRLKEASELAAQASSGNARQTSDMSATLEHQQQERERLWKEVTQILSLLATEPAATQEISQWKLTRDAETYRNERAQLEQILGPLMLQHGISVGNPRDLPLVFDVVYDELVGIGPLGPLWRDDSVTEILVDSWDRVSVERDGRLEVTPVRFRDREHANQLARDLASSVSDRALNISNPLVTAELDRARANFAYGPVVRSGLSVSLRKFRPLLSMDGLLAKEALTGQMAEFLRACVHARATIVVSGGTGTGKTTMLNALSEYIPDNERVVTIEDSFELALANLHVVSLQTKERASSDDTVRITLADLLVNSLRMRPDRIVVGEIRDPSGARAMLQAANTGHDGTMTTIHANTAEMAISDRLSDLQREATGAPDEVSKRTVASAVNLVIQVTRKNGRRFISDIAAIDRTMVREGTIRPESIFTGDIDSDGLVTFRHVGGVRSDTELGVKLAAAGQDLWRAE